MFLRHESVACDFSQLFKFRIVRVSAKDGKGKEMRKRFRRILLPDVWDAKDGAFEVVFWMTDIWHNRASKYDW